MFGKVLVANRGEIALRIVRACRDLGVRAVVAHSEADRDSLPVRLADEAICIGPAAGVRSYLNLPNVVSAALLTGCDAIHPGYGYLAENPYAAEICEKYGLVFVGPPPEAIERAGDKALCRQLMAEAGLPTLPGTDEAMVSAEQAAAFAAEIGYPVMLKAAAGGGGRGMRIARDERELLRLFPLARAEAEAAFGNGQIYLERFLESPRHVEVQVLFDRHGHGVHLGDRDCSIQRRHQKLVEEGPATGIAPETSARVRELALVGARALGYANAGTFEFLVDRAGQPYFLEVNARIQVEHPVTEELTGVDLVAWQLRLAAGEHLTLRQEDVALRGHAIECRINAEDADRGFVPSTGRITEYRPPGGPGVRVDSHLFAGYEVPPHYDSLLAKLICWGSDRAEAIARTQRALGEFAIEGVRHLIAFHRALLTDERFLTNNIATDFLERRSAAGAGGVAQEVAG